MKLNIAAIMQIRHSKLALNSPASSLFNVHIKYLLFGDWLDDANKSLATLERGSRANMKASKQLSEDMATTQLNGDGKRASSSSSSSLGMATKVVEAISSDRRLPRHS